MGQILKKERVSISKSGNSFRLRWRVNGNRFSFNPGIRYNDKNLEKVKEIISVIESDIRRDEFDATLTRYRIDKKGKHRVKSDFLLSQFDTWVVEYINGDADNPYYTDPRALLKRYGNFDLEDFLGRFNKENIAPKTYNNRLYCLRRFFKFLLKTGKLPFNPLEEVNRRRNNTPPDDKRLPLEPGEIKDFLEAIKTDKYNPPCSRYPHSHYYPFFYFIFNTGCRNAEVIGLRVKNVNITKGYIYIREVLARTKGGTNSKARIWKTTKTGKQRIVPMTSEMKIILQHQIKDKKPDDLVFTSHTGLCIDDRMLQRRVMKPVLEKMGIGDKVLYVARHSFSTIAIEQGFSPVEVSKIVGNSPETLIRNYLHLINIPKRMPDILASQITVNK